MSDLAPSHEPTEDVHRPRTFDKTQDRIETLVSHSTRLKSLAAEAKRKYASKPAFLDGSERLFEELDALADTLLELCSDFETMKREDVSGEDQEGQVTTKCRAICYLNTLWDMVQARVYEILAQLEAFTAGIPESALPLVENVTVEAEFIEEVQRTFGKCRLSAANH